MKIEKAFLIGQHLHSFRVGERSEIIGVKIIQPDSILEDRLCFEVLFDDGAIDFIPVSSYNNEHYLLTTGKASNKDGAKCICTADLTSWPVLPNPDCPVHGSLHH